MQKVLRKKTRISIGDTVLIIAGQDAGKKGIVLHIRHKDGGSRYARVMLKIAGCCLCTKHIKPTKDREGSIVSQEQYIDYSNVKVILAGGEVVRSSKKPKKSNDVTGGDPLISSH